MTKVKLKIGDRVSFLNEKMAGEVLGLKADEILVLRDDDFEEWTPANELIPERDLDPGYILSKNELNSILNQKELSSQSKSSKKHQNPDCWTIDLHIEELVDHHEQLSNYEIVQIQLNKCQQFIEKAIRNNIERLIIVHGVGQGVLREEVIKMLRMYEPKQVYDANYHTYGWGATEVIL